MTRPIEASALVRTFGDIRAVDGVDLAVEPSEIFAFLGPNGAGKTTFVRMLVTLLKPTAGSAPTRAACAGDSTWRWRWSTSQRCCSSTSRPPASTR